MESYGRPKRRELSFYEKLDRELNPEMLNFITEYGRVDLFSLFMFVWCWGFLFYIVDLLTLLPVMLLLDCEATWGDVLWDFYTGESDCLLCCS